MFPDYFCLYLYNVELLCDVPFILVCKLIDHRKISRLRLFSMNAFEPFTF